MVRYRSFSLVEVLIAMTILAIMIIPVFNLMSQSTKQSEKSMLQVSALILAETIFEHLRVKFTTRNFPSQYNYYTGVRGLLREMDCNFSSEMVQDIENNYKTINSVYTFNSYIRFKGSNSVRININWRELGKAMFIDYYGAVTAP